MALTKRQIRIVNHIILQRARERGEEYPVTAKAAMMASGCAQDAFKVKQMIGSVADFEDILGEILGVGANKNNLKG